MGQPLNHAGYESDFHAWADHQARLVRMGALGQADLDNIAEELEGLSRSERRALQSSLRLIVLHMLKLIHQPERATQSWRNTIHRERIAVEAALRDMPSLAHHLPALFDRAYGEGRRLAIQETGKDASSFPTATEVSLAQVRDDGYMPVAARQGSAEPTRDDQSDRQRQATRTTLPERPHREGVG